MRDWGFSTTSPHLHCTAELADNIAWWDAISLLTTKLPLKQCWILTSWCQDYHLALKNHPGAFTPNFWRFCWLLSDFYIFKLFYSRKLKYEMFCEELELQYKRNLADRRPGETQPWCLLASHGSSLHSQCWSWAGPARISCCHGRKLWSSVCSQQSASSSHSSSWFIRWRQN